MKRNPEENLHQKTDVADIINLLTCLDINFYQKS